MTLRWKTLTMYSLFIQSNNNKNRLEDLKNAIGKNLEEILKTTPNKKVGLITFNTEVECLGDCDSKALIISGNQLNDFNFVKNKALARKKNENQIQSTT